MTAKEREIARLLRDFDSLVEGIKGCFEELETVGQELEELGVDIEKVRPEPVP